MQKNAIGMERRVVEQFAALGNPKTGVFEDKLTDLVQIYNLLHKYVLIKKEYT